MSDKPLSEPKPRLLDLMRSRIRVKRYAIHTKIALVDWIRRCIIFHDKPGERGVAGL